MTPCCCSLEDATGALGDGTSLSASFSTAGDVVAVLARQSASPPSRRAAVMERTAVARLGSTGVLVACKARNGGRLAERRAEPPVSEQRTPKSNRSLAPLAIERTRAHLFAEVGARMESMARRINAALAVCALAGGVGCSSRKLLGSPPLGEGGGTVGDGGGSVGDGGTVVDGDTLGEGGNVADGG